MQEHAGPGFFLVGSRTLLEGVAMRPRAAGGRRCASRAQGICGGEGEGRCLIAAVLPSPELSTRPAVSFGAELAVSVGQQVAVPQERV